MVIGTLEQSFILGIMAIGVYISYKILDFPDMTADGSFPLGGAVTAALLVKGASPVMALCAAVISGALSGILTGIIHVRLRVINLLAGIIVMTGLYSINLRIMGKSNIPLFSTLNIFHGNIQPIAVAAIFLIVVKVSVDFLLKTKFGFALRALGDNETLVTSLGLDEKRIKIYGLMFSNALIALSGGLLAQYQGFADVGMGTGTIITGLASIIIGEAMGGKNKILRGTWMVIFGTVIYKGIISTALWTGMNASDLKLITSVLVVFIIYMKLKKESFKKKGRIVSA